MVPRNSAGGVLFVCCLLSVFWSSSLRGARSCGFAMGFVFLLELFVFSFCFLDTKKQESFLIEKLN